MNANRGTRLGVLLATVLAGAVVTACAAGTTAEQADKADTASGGSVAEAPAPAPAARDAALERTTIKRSVIATGSLGLAARKPDDVRRRALAVVEALGGGVDKEQATSDDEGRVEEVLLTLRVPADSFEKALDQLAALGTLEHREQSATDVTTQVIDLDAKVKAQRATVESFQRLLARARTIGEVISIEDQLTSRRGELDSLVQQQKYLADQTSMSTVEVQVHRVRHEDTDQAGGFAGGFGDGWRALGRTVVVLGVVLGAVLPFALVLALVGVLYLSVRRLRARGRSAA
ncbi:MAG: DUF4349 domain-containing protein [Nocardioidaceae bacterium]|nr:DUF4349 domain-containing protein [Nocardioidaceae bacterium]